MPAVSESKYLVNAGWDDVPHLSARVKRELEAATPPYLRKARMQGIPSLGSGAIFPVEEEVFVVEPFQIPLYWPRSFARDVGWNRTAALWGAYDRDEDVGYLYAEHYRGQAEPSIHAAAIKARGDWIPGVIDPAARGRSQSDGKSLMVQYESLGLNLAMADNSVEAGIYDVWERLSTGRLKVFSTMSNWLAEQRLYRRDEKGKIVKKFDHLMDCTRYWVKSGIKRAMVKPVKLVGFNEKRPLSADPIGGY